MENEVVEQDVFDNYEPESKSESDSFNDEDNENKISIKQEKLINKSFEIQSLISSFEYRLLGYDWSNNGDKFVYTGRVLVGDDTAQKIMLLLHPFSKEIIMIGNKKNFTWQKQLLRTRVRLASILTNAYDADLKNYREIWRTFSNLMINIGDIILEKNSKSMLESYFGIGSESKKDYRENFRNGIY